MLRLLGLSAAVVFVLFLAMLSSLWSHAEEAKAGSTASLRQEQIERARRTIRMLDEIYKRTIALITDKYVHSEEDFAAGSAAVLLFRQVSEGGTHQVRLLDATGEPYNPKNVAQDDFEKTGIQKLKEGAVEYEQVQQQDGRDVLRMVTAVPVVMERCALCHEHYKSVKAGEPIGAISYTLALE